MNRRRATAVVSLLLPAVVAAAPTPTPVVTPAPGFISIYVPPTNEDYRVYYEQLRDRRLLESVAQEFEHVLVLPAPLTLTIAECEHSTTTFDPPTRTVTICYEFLDAVLVIAGESAGTQARAEQLFSGAVTFALLAEIGRALVSVYALPASRGALVAGDEFAAITLASAERTGDPSAAAAVEFFDDALKMPDSGFEYLESHAFDRKRLESVACILYGNAPTNHAASIERGIVSRTRAAGCAEDVVAVATVWDRALKAHTRRSGATPEAK